MSYSFDLQTGNMLSRSNNLHNLTETFGYDKLHRLSTINIVGHAPFEIHYNDAGNITDRTDAGVLSYNSSLPHAVTGITNANGIVQTDQITQFNSFNQIELITENNLKLQFTYGPDQSRKYTLLSNATDDLREKYFVGNYEEITNKVQVTLAVYTTFQVLQDLQQCMY